MSMGNYFIKTVNSSNNNILIMAHRGGQGLWPANTLFAFEQAVALGADILELDIQNTSDGMLVVRHDPTVDSTTNGYGLINSMSLGEIKKLDAGYRWTADGGETFPYRNKNITIPTLEEVLQTLPGARLNIDIKPQDPDVVAPFCQLLAKYGKLDQVLVGSFHDDQLSSFRRICQGVLTAAGPWEVRLFYGLNKLGLGSISPLKAAAFQIPEYSGNIHVVDQRFIRGAHARGVQVHIWTVNKTDDMERLIDWGVDGLITDYPDRLMALLGQPIHP